MGILTKNYVVVMEDGWANGEYEIQEPAND